MCPVVASSQPAPGVTWMMQFECTVIILRTITWWLVISSPYLKIYDALYSRDLQEGQAEAPLSSYGDERGRGLALTWRRSPLVVITLSAITLSWPTTSPLGNKSSSYLLYGLCPWGRPLGCSHCVCSNTDITLVTVTQATNKGSPTWEQSAAAVCQGKRGLIWVRGVSAWGRRRGRGWADERYMAAENKDGSAAGLGAMNSCHSQGQSENQMSPMTVCVRLFTFSAAQLLNVLFLYKCQIWPGYSILVRQLMFLQ